MSRMHEIGFIRNYDRKKMWASAYIVNETKRKKCHGAIIIDAKGAVDSSSIFSLLLLFAHSRTRFFAAFTFLCRFIK